MPSYDFRILLETVEGKKTSYYSSSFVDTSTGTFTLTSAAVYDRITGSVSASYQNQTIFSGSDVNSNFTFKDNTLLSASLQGGTATGSITFTSLDTEYDRLLRYKFIGEKVTNVLGLPSDQWIYVDQVRLPVDDEANIFQGNANLGNVSISDTLTFAGGSDINSDIPILIDTGSDRYIKFVDERGISKVALRMGYDADADVYEMSGSDSFTFNIGGVDRADITSMNGNVTASGFIFSKNTDGGNSIITIENSNTDTGIDKGVGIEFKHSNTSGTQDAGKIIAGKHSGYGEAAIGSKDSNLQFFTTLDGTDTERLRIDSNGNVGIGTTNPPKTLTVEGDISASGTIFSNAIEVTHFTSSFITSSTIVTEGSNIFGDAIIDTHKFNGHITASGNISASGGLNIGEHLNMSKNKAINFNQPTINEDRILYLDGVGVIIQSSEGVSLATNVGINNTNDSGKALTVTGDISASGDFLNSQVVQMTNSSSTIDTFNTGSFQTCKYVLQVTSASNIQASEMLVINHNATASNTEYAQINSGLNLVDFTTGVVGNSVLVNAAGSFISCSVKFVRTLI
tara:strand:- start:541 stop:2247 length:1707 start_codon:yes stop_codon:yes gene_type:complete